MKANTASKTAQYMALFRALETARSKGQRLFDDPWAIHFLNKNLKLVSRLAAWPWFAEFVYSFIQRKIPGALASGLARTRYIDDLLKKVVQGGITQVIILGAGFDTRALRLDFLRGIKVIEVDHPDTSRVKLEILQNVLPALPDHIQYLQIDFNRQSLADLFRENQIDTAIRTAIIWEGVTNYLTAEAVANTFSFLSDFSKGSCVIFTYVHQTVLDHPQSFFGAESLLKNLHTIEEQWTFGFLPLELPDFVRQFGFELLEDCGAEDYRQRYIPERKNILKGYEFYRVAYVRRLTEGV
jgi:methyltransferase (TIGR00027 family)